MKKKTYETIECECGHECPIDFAIVDDDGLFVCSNCAIEMLTEYIADKNDEEGFYSIGESLMN